MAMAFARYDINIAALCKTRLHGQDALIEGGAGYTFFWNGVPEGTCRNQEVGFAVKCQLLQRILESPIDINESLMTWSIPLAKERFTILISGYTPSLDVEIHSNSLAVGPLLESGLS